MAEEAFIKSTFNFALKLFKEISKEFRKNDFFVYSPLSIQSCLTLLYMGAEGISADSIAEALAYNQTLSKVDIACLIKLLMEQSEEEDSIEVANAIFLLDPSVKISDFYKKIIQTYFHSSIEPLIDNDQKLVKAINDWLSKSTHKRMTEMLEAQDLVDANNERKKMIVLDALYFKGRWAYAFDKSLTVKRKFWHTKEAFIEVPTMEITNHFNYGRFEEFKFSVLELNYVESELSLLIFLPDEPSQLTLIEQNADQLKLYDVVAMLYLKTVQVFLPKFTLETKVDLKNSFTSMGMGNLFNKDANFNGIVEKNSELCVDSVFHKTIFAVDEEGGVVHDKDFGKTEVVFDVNKSFFFCLKHKWEHNVVISGCVRKF